MKQTKFLLCILVLMTGCASKKTGHDTSDLLGSWHCLYQNIMYDQEMTLDSYDIYEASGSIKDRSDNNGRLVKEGTLALTDQNPARAETHVYGLRATADWQITAKKLQISNLNLVLESISHPDTDLVSSVKPGVAEFILQPVSIFSRNTDQISLEYRGVAQAETICSRR